MLFDEWYMEKKTCGIISELGNRDNSVLKTHNYLFQSSSALSKEGQTNRKIKFFF